VANASSHSLRRTHANTLRRNGADLMIIKEQLGHASLAITQRYFETDPMEVQAAVDTLKF
jgi:site-specific recombinase XerD